MRTQLLLAKRLYLEASSFAARRDPISCGISISLLQDAVELYLWTLVKDRGIEVSERGGFVSYLERLKQADIDVPYAAKLKELNTARIGFKHYGNLPAETEAIKFLTYTQDFFKEAVPQHFKLEFDSLTMADLVTDATLRGHLKEAEQHLDTNEAAQAAEELAKAKTLLFGALHRLLPEVDGSLREFDRLLSHVNGGSAARAFGYLSNYLGTLREYTLVSLLRLSLHDYLVLGHALPTAQRTHSGKWFFFKNQNEYTVDECKKALNSLVNLAIQLENLK